MLKTPFENRYAGMYDINYGSLAGNPGKEKEAQDRAAKMKLLAGILPVAGQGLGTLGGAALGSVVPGVGTALGASLGGAAGGALGGIGGGVASAQGDSELDDERKRALERQALYDAIRGLR